MTETDRRRAGYSFHKEGLDPYYGVIYNGSWTARIWECSHRHSLGQIAQDCANEELDSRRGYGSTFDPDKALDGLRTVLRIMTDADPESALVYSRGAADLFRRLDQWLANGGRFPAAWTDRPLPDGPRRYQADKPTSGHKLLHRRVISEIEGSERRPVLVVPENLAVDAVEALQRVYETGRQDTWRSRSS